MSKNTKYVSEATNFINEMLKKKPELREKQQSLKKTWWDVGFPDQEEVKSETESSIAHEAYVYYTYDHK